MKKISKCSALAVLAGLLLSLMLTACGGGTASSGSSSGTSSVSGSDPASTGSSSQTGADSSGVDENAVITMAVTGAWNGLCPLAATSYIEDCVNGTIFDPLFESDGQGGLAMRLAESYEMTDDNTAMLVHLHKDAKWHDGEPVTADDVIFTSRLTTKGSFTSSRRLFFQMMDGCDSSGVELSTDSVNVEKIDDYTVKFHYRQKVSDKSIIPNAYCFFILPEHLLKDADPATILENDFWLNPVGSGAFTLESNTNSDTLTVAANKDYYLGAPKYAKLVIKNIPSANLITAMMSGEVDIINGTLSTISNVDYPMAASIEGYTVESLESTSQDYLALNNEVFNTAKIRKALAMLLDKDKMIQAGMNGNGVPTETIYAPLSMWRDEAVIEEYGYSFDPETAVQMLRDEGFDFDRTYTIAIRDDAIRQAATTVMQETWQNYGLKLQIQTLDTPTCISTMREGGCDFWINGGFAMNPADIRAEFYDWVAVDENGDYAPFNLSKIKDTAYMDLELQLQSAVTDEEIQQVISEIQKLVLTEYNYIWLYSPNMNVAVSEKVQGINKTMMLARSFDYENWYVTA